MVLTENQGTNPELDQILLDGLRSRDRKSIEEIYREFFGMIQSLVTHNNGSQEDAADIFQEAMIVLYEKSLLPGFELRCRLKTYLYSICRRLWLKKLQTEYRKTIKVELLEEFVPVEDEIAFHQERQMHFNRMQQSLEKLGEPCRGLITAFYLLKKPMNQIASEFGYTNAENAKTQKYKCLVRLKKIFFEESNNRK